MAVGYGKVILLGEHAVVYGRPALAAALGRGCRAVAEPSTSASLRLEARDPSCARHVDDNKGSGSSAHPRDPQLVFAEHPCDDPEHEMLRRAFCAVLDCYPKPRPSLAVQVQVAVPGGAGLGCSAAMGVSVARAIDKALGIDHDNSETVEICMAWERVFHGNPSGIDPTVAANGGVLIFQRRRPDDGTEPANPENARGALEDGSARDGFQQQVVPRDNFQLVVTDSGSRSSTKTMVDGVAKYRSLSPERAERAFDEIAQLVREARIAIETGNLSTLGQLMDQNQVLLDGIGVSTPHLEQLCQAARQAGALGAKLTGAGGGGCAIALAPDTVTAGKVLEKMRELSCEAFVAEVGA